MKKYIPEQMIRRSRFITFFETWNENEKIRNLIKDGGVIC